MRLRSAGATLSAAVTLATVLVAAGSAQASLPAPEWWSGKKAITSTIAFKIEAGSGSLTLGSSELTWSGVRGEGQLEAPGKVGKLKLWFTGSAIGSCTVNSPGAKAGEVVTSELEGRLGYTNEHTPTVGVLLAPHTGAFLEVASVTCHKTAVSVVGSVIGGINPIDKEVKSFTVSFREHSGAQEYGKFEGEAAGHLLEYTEGSSGGISVFRCGEEKLTLGTEVEIKT